MASYNKVLLMGNLTRDPEVRYTPKGTAIANLGLAVNRTYTTDSGEQKEEVTFVDIEVWGRQAETSGQYLAKGRPVFIEGRLRLDSWEDKETGQKRNKMKVVAERVQFLGTPKADAEFSDQSPESDRFSKQKSAGSEQPFAQGAVSEKASGAVAASDDNIPF